MLANVASWCTSNSNAQVTWNLPGWQFPSSSGCNHEAHPRTPKCPTALAHNTRLHGRRTSCLNLGHCTMLQQANHLMSAHHVHNKTCLNAEAPKAMWMDTKPHLVVPHVETLFHWSRELLARAKKLRGCGEDCGMGLQNLQPPCLQLCTNQWLMPCCTLWNHLACTNYNWLLWTPHYYTPSRTMG